MTVNGGTLLVQTTNASHVIFTITGLASDDNGTLTFSDENPHADAQRP
jgi:hypothetical protein